MKCVSCKCPGVWSQRFGAILCNACTRTLERRGFAPLSAERMTYGVRNDLKIVRTDHTHRQRGGQIK